MFATVPIKNEIAAIRETMNADTRRLGAPSLFLFAASFLVAPVAIVAEKVMAGDLGLASVAGIATSGLMFTQSIRIANRYSRNHEPLINRLRECCKTLTCVERQVEKIKSEHYLHFVKGTGIRDRDVFGRVYEESGTVKHGRCALPHGRIPGAPEVDRRTNPKFYGLNKA